MKTQGVTLAGSVIGGILASVCCIGPLVLALLGISGAAFAQRFEPLRPYLLIATYALLAGAFYSTYRPAPSRTFVRRTLTANSILGECHDLVVSAFPAVCAAAHFNWKFGGIV